MTTGLDRSNNSMMMASTQISTIWSYLCPFYWIITGVVYSKMFNKSVRGLVMGCLPILALLFVSIGMNSSVNWGRNLVSNITVSFVSGLMRLTNTVILFFTDVLSNFASVTYSYIFILVLFSIGYLLLNKKKHNIFI